MTNPNDFDRFPLDLSGRRSEGKGREMGPGTGPRTRVGTGGDPRTGDADANGGRPDASADLPADIRGMDQLLRHMRTPAADMPADLVDRIFIASRGLLPTPAPAVEIVSRIGPSPRLRWARLAMAVAACVAVAAGTMVVLRAPTAKPTTPAEFVAAVPDAPADEAMLVALLDGRTSSDTWVSDDTFNRNTFAQDVAPVLRSRDTDYVGLATEVQAIFGASLGVGVGPGVGSHTEL